MTQDDVSETMGNLFAPLVIRINYKTTNYYCTRILKSIVLITTTHRRKLFWIKIIEMVGLSLVTCFHAYNYYFDSWQVSLTEFFLVNLLPLNKQSGHKRDFWCLFGSLLICWWFISSWIYVIFVELLRWEVSEVFARVEGSDVILFSFWLLNIYIFWL